MAIKFLVFNFLGKGTRRVVKSRGGKILVSFSVYRIVENIVLWLKWCPPFLPFHYEDAIWSGIVYLVCGGREEEGKGGDGRGKGRRG